MKPQPTPVALSIQQKKISEIREDLTPVDVLQPLGFKTITFEQLSPELREALEKAKPSWQGNPLLQRGEIDRGSLILSNDEGSVIYFMKKKGNGKFLVTRAERTSNRKHFDLHPIEYPCTVAKIIRKAAFFDIKHFQRPEDFPYEQKNDTRDLLDVFRTKVMELKQSALIDSIKLIFEMYNLKPDVMM